MVMFGLSKAFKEVVRNMLEWASRNDNQAKEADYNTIMPSTSRGRGLARVSSGPSSDIEDHNRGFNFTVYNATGGKVTQIQNYDPVKDKTSSSLYIITDKENLGEELSLIIMKESLSR
jgi:hypothetical protein